MTPEQMIAQYGKPTGTPQGATQNARYAADDARWGLSSSQTPPPQTPSTPPASTQPSKPSALQSIAGSIINPLETSAARGGQAVGSLLMKGIDTFTGGALGRLTPEGNLDAALNRALNMPQQLPVTGGELKPISQETPETVAGHALGTVALGIPSPMAAGGVLGASGAMEQGGGAGQVSLDTIIGMVGGKVLDVGLSKAMPYIERAAAQYGTPFLEKLQAHLPDYAKPTLDNLIQSGKKSLQTQASNKLDFETSSLIPEGGKIEVPKARDAAWQDIQPKLTPTTKAQYGAERAVSSQGVFSKAQLTPTGADSKVIDTLQPLYENGRLTPNMPIDQKLSIIDQESARLHADQKGFLADHNIAVPLEKTSVEKGLFPTLADKSERSKLVFSGDPAASGAYDSAIAVFKRNLTTGTKAGTTKNATTLTNIDDALTAFDKEMEKFGAWERSQTGQLTETDKARITAIRDIHTTARDYIDSHLPKNSPWKSIRLNESNLYEAAQRMSPKLGDTVGQSGWSQFWKEHPDLKRGALWAAGTAVGTGGVIGGESLLH